MLPTHLSTLGPGYVYNHKQHTPNTPTLSLSMGDLALLLMLAVVKRSLFATLAYRIHAMLILASKQIYTNQET
jgi:hypothetical protein